MAARLILNADDFGLTRGINRAVAELHSAGALTSTTLMANGPAFDDAVAIAHAHPSLGVGCHVVLVDGTPLSPPASIPSLIGKDGKSFRTSLPDFLLAALRGAINEDDILREATAQIRHMQSAGLHVTHLDTHKHTHTLPTVARPLLQAAVHAGIRAVRNPFEPAWSRCLAPAPFARRFQVAALAQLRSRFAALPQIRDGLVQTTAGSLGITATGQLNGPTLSRLLHALPSGVWELVCHPGYTDAGLDNVRTRLRHSREIERNALLEIFAAKSPHPSLPQLIHYGDLDPSHL
jgi:predicted glycoside hydrolase/deacetylase ChbG (UPF0249 family)